MTDHESDREKYARRLAMFRSMGFDTSKLEDMLEHDFDRLKEMGFDHIREQLEMAERREAEDEARTEAAKARTELPPPPPRPKWLERDDERDRRLEDVLKRDHRFRGPPPERQQRAGHLPPDVRKVRHYKDARYDDMDYRERDDFEDFESREDARYYGPDERSREPEFRPPPGEEELEAGGDEDEEDGDDHIDGGRRERRFIDGMRREMLDRRDREDGMPPAPRYAPRERRAMMRGERRPLRDRMGRPRVDGRDDRPRGSRRMMGGVRERPREPPRSRREEMLRHRRVERRIDTLDPMISFKPAKDRDRPSLLDIEDEEEEDEEEGGKDILIGGRGRENGKEEGDEGGEYEEEDEDDKEVAMIFIGDKKHKEAKEALFGGEEEEEGDEEDEDEEPDVSRTDIGPEPDDLDDEEEGGVEEVHVVEAEPDEMARERPRPKLRPRPRQRGPPGEGPIQIRSVPETDRFALKARRRPLKKISRGRGPMAAHPPSRGMGQRHMRREGTHHDARERYGPSAGRVERGYGERRFAPREGHAPGPAPRVVRKIKKKSTLRDRERKDKGKGNLATFATICIVIIVILAAYYLFFLPTTVVAKISATKTDPTVAEEVGFSGSGSRSSSGSIGKFQWDFGDTSLIAEGEEVTHTYDEEGDFIVKLTVKDKAGRMDTAEMSVHVKGLSTKATEPQYGDEATYDVVMHVDTENFVAGLFTLKDLPTQIIDQITIQRITADLTGDQVSSEEEMVEVTDGMGSMHSCAHRHIVSDMDMTGTITTDFADVPISGNVKVTEDAYRLTTSGKGIRSRTDTVTTLDPVTFQGIPVSERMTSKDNVTLYNDLTTLDDQFDIAEIYRGKTFSSQDPSSANATITRGEVTFKSRYDGSNNMGERPSIKLNVTIDAKAMAYLRADELYIDIWVGNNVPVETGLHIYYYSKQGDTVTEIDYTATLGSFVRGLSPITPEDEGDFLPAHPLASTAPFDRTPIVGDPNGSSVEFPPDEALAVAKNMSAANLSAYLSDPGVYMVQGNYTNDPDPRWSMVFSRERSDKGFVANVTREKDPMTGLFTYTYEEQVEDITPITVQRSQLPEVLNLSSAEDILRTDPGARVAMFDGERLITNGTFMYTQADLPYPTSDLTFSAFSTGSMPYAYRFTHAEEGDAAAGSFTVALSAINGQFMYIEEHSGKGIPGIPGLP